MQLGELEGEGRQPPSHKLPSLGIPRVRCLPPGATELTPKVQDARQRDGQLSPVLLGLPQARGP